MNLKVKIAPQEDTVWLTQGQISELFDTARSSIAYHINNIFKEELIENISVEISDRSLNKASNENTASDTSDTSSINGYLITMILALMGMVYVVIRRKKNEVI